MTGGNFIVDTGTQKIDVFLTRSGYTGEDGFEISVHESQAEALARALLASPKSNPSAWVRATRCAWKLACAVRQRHRHHHDPVEASLLWAMQRVRRAGVRVKAASQALPKY